MLDQEHLIRLLNQPGAQSGTLLGNALGVSRVAVQKRIQQLIENGLPIAAVSGKGYTLEDGVHLLDEQEILAALSAAEKVAALEVVQSIESTNSYLLSQPISVGCGRVCVAESQTVGRGRRGNDWQSASYRNIMLSMSWGFSHWPETVTGLGLAVALVAVEHINESYDLNVQIKWPNDLMVGDDKLGGILVDVAGESSGGCNVVIGLGLNVHQPDWSQADSAYRWQDLNGLGAQVNRNTLVANIVDAWLDMLSDFEQRGFAPYTERWNALSSYAGRQIRVGDENEFIVGQMRGVDAFGALLVEDQAGQMQRFVDSNVSVRLV